MMQLRDESNWRRKPLFLYKSVKESKNRKNSSYQENTMYPMKLERFNIIYNGIF